MQTKLKLRKTTTVKAPKKVTRKFNLTHVENPTLAKTLDCFLNTEETKARFSKYFVDGNALYYRTTDNRLHVPKLIEHIVALKVNGIILGNSSVLPYIEAKSVIKLNKGQTEVQRILSEQVPMMPFGVFEEANLDVSKLKIVERGKEESVTIKVSNPKFPDKDGKQPEFFTHERHYTGACLFRIGKDYFLFDIDRREIEHGVFNAFLVKLGSPAKSIADAYRKLKPKAVIEAEKSGLKVLRQGEWFFIPVDAKTVETINSMPIPIGAGGRKTDSITLQAGKNRPNYAEGIELKDGKRLIRSEMEWNARRNTKADVTYLTGKVEHSGREHATLNLKGWYTAVPNTATESFTITGDVD